MKHGVHLFHSAATQQQNNMARQNKGVGCTLWTLQHGYNKQEVGNLRPTGVTLCQGKVLCL